MDTLIEWDKFTGSDEDLSQMTDLYSEAVTESLSISEWSYSDVQEALKGRNKFFKKWRGNGNNSGIVNEISNWIKETGANSLFVYFRGAFSLLDIEAVISGLDNSIDGLQILWGPCKALDNLYVYEVIVWASQNETT